MANTTLNQAYAALAQTHNEYARNRDQWQFFMESFTGGQEYRDAGHLTRYQLETTPEYQQRLRMTALDNHCNAVISTYNSFLFRECPEREFGMMQDDPALNDFLGDCDYDGRSLDMFMKDVSTWAGVFGSCWIMLTKPNIGAATLADEMAAEVRPYLSLMTPLVVSDWKYRRNLNGQYELTYLQYVEEIIDNVTIVRVWTQDVIQTWELNDSHKEAVLILEELDHRL